MAQASWMINAAARRGNARERAGALQETVLFHTAMLCVICNVLLEEMGISIHLPNYDRPTMFIGLGCCFWLLNKKQVLQKLRGKSYMLILPLYAVFALLMTISSFYTKDIVPTYNTITKNILLQGFMFEGICLVLYALAMGRTQEMIKFVFLCMAGLAIVSDLMMFAGIHFTDGAFETYFIGTKFDIVYLHMNLMAMYFSRLKLNRKGKREKKLPLRLLLSFMMINVLISIRVDCNTGMLGSFMIVGIVYLCDRSETAREKVFGSGRFFLLILVISMMFAYYIFWILEQPIVKYIIVDKLGRSLTLTGRTDIYILFPSVMKSHWLWGYGYGNSYPICTSLFGYTDVQNALLQWVIQVGVPSTAMLCLIFYYIIRMYRKAGCMMSGAPIIALIYVYLLLGTVEITINYNFIMFILILFMMSCEQLDSKRIPGDGGFRWKNNPIKENVR